MQLKENKEFKELIPPISPEEYSSLEGSILAEGCRDPLIVWAETIVDGHNRYKICCQYNVNFKTKDITFEGEADAKIWIIKNQLSRRNISTADRIALNLKLKPLLSAEAKKRQGTRTDLGKNFPPDLAESREEIAELSHSSQGTVYKVEVILQKAPELMEKIRNNETSIDRAFKDITQEEKKEKVKEEFKQKGINDFPKGKFQVIYADPPWEYDFSETQSREIENHYPTMKLKDIKELTDGKRTVQDLLSDDCVLFLWTTSPKLEEGLSVLNEWGFKYVTCAIWDKKVMGMGYYFRQQNEILLVGKRGNLPLPDPENRVSSIISAKRTEHSRKPEEVYEILEKMYPERTKIELFSRNGREGWTMWGNGINTPQL